MVAVRVRVVSIEFELFLFCGLNLMKTFSNY